MSFDPAQFAQSALSAGSQQGWESYRLCKIGEWERPWFQRRTGKTDAPALYISAGIHGDEPAGSYAALELLRHPEIFHGLDVTLFPMLNPAGLAANTRENAAGIDLNRDYRDPKSEEIRSHLATLQTLGQYTMTLCLHEDWEMTGFYFYELNVSGEPACGLEIQRAMAEHLPIETRAVIDDFEAKNGIIARNAELLRLPRPQWPEAFYLSHYHTQLGYTFETPSKAAPLESRVAAHVAGVRAAAHFARTQRLVPPRGTMPSLSQ
ncbi:MAG: hypothetical protein B9S32_15910 [Verrucomicrobia bacterium Tous-C9LFEB]|nr:MAG: hypothetical protein B9S32_15910 [Verrucomicrobia bacterium Tous-C9LFEB]